MNITDKIDKYLNEKKEIPRGVLNWVVDYIEMRTAGNTKGAKDIKKQIDAEIKKLGLNKKDVYSYFGDPDDPKQKDKVKKNIKKFKN